MDPVIVSALLFAFLSLIFLIAAFAAAKKRKIFTAGTSLLTALLMLSLAALSGTISIAIQGYQALTHEALAATVKITPVGDQQFTAKVILPDGSRKIFSLAGDELYVDAHILKWKPWANILGLHTSYELDRIAGRYAVLSDETSRPHTVYALSREKPVNMFALRRRFAVLAPFLDTEYGSATFINTNTAEEFKVLVSTTGLLIRKSEKEPEK
jgi:hypothetical protein